MSTNRAKRDPLLYRDEVTDHIRGPASKRVHEHMQSGRHLGVRSTPAFFVNGVFADVSFGMQHLHEAIDRALLTA